MKQLALQELMISNNLIINNENEKPINLADSLSFIPIRD